MTYEVTLTKWRTVTLSAAVICLAGLLFVCGVLVGLGLWKPTMDEIALAKGYKASIFDALDSERRMWHVVRIGRYQDVASAAVDAARIGGKEQLQALIRRGGRL